MRVSASLTRPDKPEKRENLLLNLTLNVAIPALVLMQFSGEAWLGAKLGLLVALAFPLAYGLYDFALRRSFNLLSVLGIAGVLSTAGVGLLRLDVRWIAIKEAAQPLILGLVVLVSLKTPFPFIKSLLASLVNFDKLRQALQERGELEAFERRLVYATYILASSFFLSATLNYLLAKIIVVSQPGTVAFNEELGKMTALSMPVIGGPMVVIMALAVLVLVNDIKKLTGLTVFNLLR